MDSRRLRAKGLRTSTASRATQTRKGTAWHVFYCGGRGLPTRGLPHHTSKRGETNGCASTRTEKRERKRGPVWLSRCCHGRRCGCLNHGGSSTVSTVLRQGKSHPYVQRHSPQPQDNHARLHGPWCCDVMTHFTVFFPKPWCMGARQSLIFFLTNPAIVVILVACQDPRVSSYPA